MAIDYRMIVGTKIDGTDIQQQIDKLPVKKIVVQPTVKGSKEIKTMTDDMGRLVTTTTQFNKVGDSTGTTLSKVSTNFKDTSNQIKTASTHTETLTSKFTEIIKKVTAFGLATSVIGLFTKSMYEALQVVKEFDSAMTEFKKVSDLSGEGLENYTEKLGELGAEIARTRTQMVEASTEFVKSGYTEEQSAQLAKVAGLYQNVADSEISAGESSAYLISQMKAFNITATDAIGIIDKTNAIGNAFAVSTSDISTALTKSSSALAVYGNTMSETMSLVTAGTELMTGQASKVSKGLRSIGANIVKLASDTGVLEYSVNGATKSLSLFDEQGQMLSTFDVLKEVSKDWDNMTNAEKSSLALAQAGKPSCRARRQI